MTSKPCFVCKAVKPLHLFYKHARMADGHLNKCIECVKAYCAERQRQGKTRDYDRERAQRPDRVEARRAYAKSEAGRAAKLRWQEKSRALNRKKHQARAQVAYALRLGKLQRHPCHVCGSEKTEAHHPDYDRPLDVVWLCQPHHAETHKLVANDAQERQAA
jgi:hypothetical protein